VLVSTHMDIGVMHVVSGHCAQKWYFTIAILIRLSPSGTSLYHIWVVFNKCPRQHIISSFYTQYLCNHPILNTYFYVSYYFCDVTVWALHLQVEFYYCHINWATRGPHMHQQAPYLVPRNQILNNSGNVL